MAKTLEQIQAELDALKTQFSDFSALSPVSYYTHQYSGEEIDDSVGVTQGTVPTLVRPNLLDNWYFGRPVNQRGGTEYTGQWIYTIDRWQTSADMSVTVGSDGIVLNGNGDQAGSYIFQRVEALPAGTYTLSIYFKANTGSVGLTNIFTDNGAHSPVFSSAGSGVISLTFRGTAAIGSDLAYSRIHSSGEAKILAAKLELGPTQTLAHQDASGEWVLNEIPDYGEELRRCRRYCRAYKAGTTLPCLAYPMPDGGWYASAGLPTNSMRTTPTNNLGDGKKCAIVDLDGSDYTHDDMTMTNWGQNGNMLCLRISGGTHGTLTSKLPYYIKLKEDLIMSADL